MIHWLLVGLLLAGQARAGELTVLTAGAIRTVAEAVATAFQASTGTAIVLRNDTAGALVRRIALGEAFDVILTSPATLEELARIGKIGTDPPVRLARVGVGLAVAAGEPLPDIGTVDAFKATMLRARAVAYINPASGGSSGIYVAQLFQTLGIDQAMAAKSVLVNGGLAAEAVADGRADMALQQISELMAVPGVTLAGPLPAAIQQQTIYAGALSAATPSRDAAQAFLEAMADPSVWPVLQAHALTPP